LGNTLGRLCIGGNSARSSRVRYIRLCGNPGFTIRKRSPLSLSISAVLARRTLPVTRLIAALARAGHRSRIGTVVDYAVVVFSMLKEGFSTHPIAADRRLTGQGKILLENLCSVAAHFPFRAVAIEIAVGVLSHHLLL
jgi:hypothetical protein